MAPGRFGEAARIENRTKCTDDDAAAGSGLDLLAMTLLPEPSPPDVVVHQALQTSRVGVQVRVYEWTEASEDSGWVPPLCYLDLSLTARPDQARGWYRERWRPGRSELIGDVMFVPASLDFRGSHGPGRQTSLTLFLAPELFSLELGSLQDAALAEGLHVSDDEVRLGLWRLAAEVRRPRLASPLAMEVAAISIAERLERHLAKAPPRTGPKRGGLPPSRMRLIEERLRADLPAPSVAELAALCGLSQRQLARAFREEAGQSIGRRVGAAGLQRAWRLLTETSLSIKEVAHTLGFCSSASFAAAFRGATGRRPSEMRV